MVNYYISNIISLILISYCLYSCCIYTVFICRLCHQSKIRYIMLICSICQTELSCSKKCHIRNQLSGGSLLIVMHYNISAVISLIFISNNLGSTRCRICSCMICRCCIYNRIICYNLRYCSISKSGLSCSAQCIR